MVKLLVMLVGGLRVLMLLPEGQLIRALPMLPELLLLMLLVL